MTSAAEDSGQDDASEAELLDVGGRRLSVEWAGAADPPPPAVLLEAGAGRTAQDWDRVFPEVARFARVGRYDRAGVGRSDPGPSEGQLPALAADLEAVLSAAGGAQRWVLVGHSRGALVVRLYAALHPAAIAGLVLVDPEHEDAQELYPPLLPATDALRPHILAAKAQCDRRREDLRVAGPPPPVPLVVLSAGAPWTGRGALPADWPWAAIEGLGLHEQLAGLSPRGRRVIVPGSGHYIQEDRPAVVVGAIREVVEAAQLVAERG
jgi:pimeloyl-ACP methyl ester carboxylesterase